MEQPIGTKYAAHEQETNMSNTDEPSTVEEIVRFPSLPDKISNNGKELWEWGAKLGRIVHLEHEARTLKQQIADVQRKCGSCTMWMTRNCPKEKPNMTGYSSGPHMNYPACNIFVMEKATLDLINDWQKKLCEMNAKLTAIKY